MKTPFDAALRVAERRVERVRVEIGVAVERLQAIDRDHHQTETAMMRELGATVHTPLLTTEGFFLRARERRTRLQASRAAAQARLADLRRGAVDAYGRQAAVAEAMDRFRAGQDAASATAEQAIADDLSGAVHARRSRRRTVPS